MESTEKKSTGLNLKATELRLGLPGSESPERSFSPASLLPKPLHDDNKPHISAPAAKSQVVGWPPIRSFRKNSMGTTHSQPHHKDDDAEEAKSGCFYVKVSMEGAPYLRKVDLNTFTTYNQLSSSLQNMFSCFTISQCGSYGVPCRQHLSESKLMDLLHGSEYVLTYQDKDGDWMLVGDVPWEICAYISRQGW